MKNTKYMLLTLVLGGLLWIVYINEEMLHNGHWFYQGSIIPIWLNDYRNSRPIFFTITAENQTNLPLRLACAIESASFHHPNRTIFVLSMSKLRGYPIDILRLIPNVQFYLLNAEQILSQTPLELWYKNDSYKNGRYVVNHMSDAIRLALLFKCGGIYLDTDVICLQPLDELRNAVGLQDEEEVNGAVLIFEPQHKYIYRCMEVFASDYNKDSWAAQGPELLTYVLKESCFMANLSTASEQVKLCLDVHVLPTMAFYPIPYPNWEDFFIPYQKIHFNSSVYTIHLWNKLSGDSFIRPGSHSILDTIAKVNCPKIYDLIRAYNIF